MGDGSQSVSMKMVANGMRPQMVDQIVELMMLQYDYLRRITPTCSSFDR